MYPFNTFTADMVNHFLPGQRAMQDILIGPETEVVSAAGAVSIALPVTNLSVTGTVAYTLADGPAGVSGMTKRIVCTVAATTPLGTLTIASPETTTGLACAATFLFTAVGQAIELLWTGTKWRCTRVQRAGIKAAIDAGTTSLTGMNLYKVYSLAVTDTDTAGATTTLPAGSAVGETCSIVCESVSGTPIGSVTGTYLGMFGTAYTLVGAIGVVASATAVGDCALLEWNGSAWLVTYQNGCTLS